MSSGQLSRLIKPEWDCGDGVVGWLHLGMILSDIPEAVAELFPGIPLMQSCSYGRREIQLSS